MLSRQLIRSTLLTLAILCYSLPQAGAAPYDGPRVAHSYAGDVLPLHPVPGAFSVTWAPGVQEHWRDQRPAQRGPEELLAGAYRLRRGKLRGPPRYHTEEYHLIASSTGGKPKAAAVARELMQLPGVLVAGPLYRRTETDRAPTRAMTPRLLLQLQSNDDESTMRRLARELGLEVRGRRGLAPNQWLLTVPRLARVDPIEAATALQESPATRWAQVDWLRQRANRYIPSDPEFPSQWHLENTGQAGGIPGHDLNATGAWDYSLGSSDVIIAVLDSGIQPDHPDLVDDLVAGYDFIDGDDNPSSSDSHGTKCAGAAAAPDQGIGVVGTCPGCRIMPIRMLGVGDAGEADAHDFAVSNGAWVISNSWGPLDGTGAPAEIPAVVAAAIDYATSEGRGGRGVAIFWASGNGHPVDTCSDDGYVSYPSTIAIGASTNEGQRAGYSESCPELNLSAPSNGGTAAITTTTTGSDYSSSFGGTSAAAPVAAGVGGLILSSIPELSWDSLRDLLQGTATKIDPGDANYDSEGHSELYGYGRIDAQAAVEAEIVLLSLPATTVGCEDQVPVSVLMPNNPGLTGVSVLAASAREPEGELFVVEEGSPGNYDGTVDLGSQDPSAGDGLLSVSHGDLVTVASADAEVSKSFDVDCEGPEILVPLVFDLTAWTATITWQTSEPSDATVTWASEDAPALTETQYDETIDYYHELQLTELSGCIDYQATLLSVDPLGNEGVEALLQWTSPGDPTLLPEDAIPGADPCDPSTWHLPGDDDDDDDPPLTGRGGCEGQACSYSTGPDTSMPAACLILALLATAQRRRTRRHRAPTEL